MSGIAWIILDCLLALAAVGGTVKVIATPPPAPLPAERLEPKASQKNAEKAGAEKRPTKDAAAKETAANPDALPANASLDDLWKKTLFLPSRQEQEPSETAAELSAEAAAAAAKNFEFELIGIAQISPADQPPTPVAILRSKQQASSRNTGRNRRGRNKDAQKEPETKKAAQAPVKLIFHEGDRLNDTGYLLKAIHPDQKMVEIVRGTETLQLRINYAGEEATKRRQEMAEAIQSKKEQQAQEQQQASIRQRQAQQAQEAKEQEAAKNQANPGQPPPPPGMGNNFPGQNNNAAATNNSDRALQNNADNGPTSDLQRSVEQRARQRQQDGDNASSNNSSNRRRGTGRPTAPQK